MVSATSPQDIQEAEIDAALTEYVRRIYGGSDGIHDMQLREVRQAFLSGVHWLNTHPGYVPSVMERSLKTILTRDSHLPDSSP